MVGEAGESLGVVVYGLQCVGGQFWIFWPDIEFVPRCFSHVCVFLKVNKC